MSTPLPRPSYGFTLTLAASGFISLILAILPSMASPSAYVPPARETPLRTESAGVRLSGEKGPSNVTQNTLAQPPETGIATERLITYSPGITSILDWLQALILRTQDQSNSSTQAQP